MNRCVLTMYLSQDGAVCLDGSPGAYYWRQGSGSGAQSWILFFEGGGWLRSHPSHKLLTPSLCLFGTRLTSRALHRRAGFADAVGGFDSCLSRSEGGLGSTKGIEPTMHAGYQGFRVPNMRYQCYCSVISHHALQMYNVDAYCSAISQYD